MMVRALSLVPGGGQCGGGKLKRRVICNVEPPIGNQFRRLAGLKISIRDGEEVPDLLSAGRVRSEPSEIAPVYQAH